MSFWTGTDLSGSVTSDWMRTPDNCIEQWGVGVITTDSSQVSFPIPFPDKVLWLAEQDNSGGARKTFWQLNDITDTGFTAVNLATISKGATTVNASVNARVTWFASGI